jgi:DNA replication and repair protein RecF
LIRTGQSAAYISAQFTEENQSVSASLKIPQTGSILLNVNQKPERKISVLDSLLSCVIFTFSDLEIVQGQPAKRREIFDQILSIRDPKYAQLIRTYKKILETRARILRELSRNFLNMGNNSALDPINQQLIETGSAIIAERLVNLDFLNHITNQFYSYFIGTNASISFDYQSSFLLKGRSLDEIQTQFSKVIDFNRKVEIQAAHNLFGPHRDDIQIFASGNSTRQFFSLGEQWSLAISLKLTLAQIIEQSTSVKPFLLLDDVFSIIDDLRAQRLIERLINFGQTFVTTARASDLLLANSHKIELQL